MAAAAVGNIDAQPYIELARNLDAFLQQDEEVQQWTEGGYDYVREAHIKGKQLSEIPIGERETFCQQASDYLKTVQQTYSTRINTWKDAKIREGEDLSIVSTVVEFAQKYFSSGWIKIDLEVYFTVYLISPQEIEQMEQQYKTCQEVFDRFQTCLQNRKFYDAFLQYLQLQSYPVRDLCITRLIGRFSQILPWNLFFRRVHSQGVMSEEKKSDFRAKGEKDASMIVMQRSQ